MKNEILLIGNVANKDLINRLWLRQSRYDLSREGERERQSPWADRKLNPSLTSYNSQVIKTVESLSPSAGKFNLQEHLFGGVSLVPGAMPKVDCLQIPFPVLKLCTELCIPQASIDAHGTPLTDETLAAAKSANAVLLGSIGGPEWGPSSPVRPEAGILKLRKELETYGNLRPCSFASESLVDSSPLKADVCRGTDFVVVRELTGGIYFGDRVEDDGVKGFAMDTEPYSKAEIERIARLSAFLALAQDPPAKVWSLDKANVLATSRLWRKTVTELFKNEFPQLQLEHQLIDSAAMLMVKSPRTLNGIVMTSNLFGDIISDEASVIPGSIGLLPSASLGGLPDGKSKCNGIYEPIHGKLIVSFYAPQDSLCIQLMTDLCHKAPHLIFPARASSTPSAPSCLSP